MVRKALQALAFRWSEAADGPALGEQGFVLGVTAPYRRDGAGNAQGAQFFALVLSERPLPARIGMAPVMAHGAECGGEFGCVGAVILAGESDGWDIPMHLSPQTRRDIPCDINDRAALIIQNCYAPCPVLADVEAIGAQGMGNERFALEIQSDVCPAVRVDRRGYVDCSSSVVSAEGNKRAYVALSIGVPAPASSARRNCAGNSFPIFSARRRIPAQAFGLKKNRCGSSPVSKMADNEQTLAPLCQTGKLSIKASPGEAIPEFRQTPEEGAQIPPFVRGTDSGHVLPNDPIGAITVNDLAKAEGEVRTRIIQALAESGDGEPLAGGSSNKDIQS